MSCPYHIHISSPEGVWNDMEDIMDPLFSYDDSSHRRCARWNHRIQPKICGVWGRESTLTFPLAGTLELATMPSSMVSWWFWGRGQTMLFQGTDPEKDRKYLWRGSEPREGAVKFVVSALEPDFQRSDIIPIISNIPNNSTVFYGVSQIFTVAFAATRGRICWPQSQSWDRRRSSSWMSGAKDDKIWGGS